jgi:hypothetical protein
MYYIGLDVHKKTISYCVKDASGQVRQEGQIGATRRELDGWMKTLPQPWTVAMVPVETMRLNSLRAIRIALLRTFTKSMRRSAIQLRTVLGVTRRMLANCSMSSSSSARSFAGPQHGRPSQRVLGCFPRKRLRPPHWWPARMDDGLPEAALALLYSGIDALGLLAAPAGTPDACKTTFTDWCAVPAAQAQRR